MDTRDLGEDEYAMWMRTRRGDSPMGPREALLDRGTAPCSMAMVAAPKPNIFAKWMAWVTVRDSHPWNGEAPEDCEGAGIELLNPRESAESSIDTDEHGGWMLAVFCESKVRAQEMEKHMAQAAEAAVLPRQDGAVVSSR